MKKLIPIIAILLTLTLLVGCGAESGPKKVAKKFLNAIQDGKYEKAVDAMYPGYVEAKAKQYKDVDAETFAEDYFAENVEDQKFELRDFEIIDVYVEEDYEDEIKDRQETLEDKDGLDVDFEEDITAIATVYFRVKTYEKEEKEDNLYSGTDSISLIKVGGKWYVAETYIGNTALEYDVE